jgi:hypothetical protein
MYSLRRAIAYCVPLFGFTVAQGSGGSPCDHALAPSYAAPSMAPGYTARLIETGLTKPRGIMFDTEGRLLVVQAGMGLTTMELDDSDDDCVSVRSHDMLVSDSSV